MPIYMDRHDVSETVTAENVAELHQADLKIQHKFDCKGLTYWYDENRKTAFCLVEAPNAEAIQKMHDHAHGEVPHRIIEVDADIVESFLGRIEDPQKAKDKKLNIINDPAFRAIMVISILVPRVKKTDALTSNSTIDTINTSIMNVIEHYSGGIVKRETDGFLISFESISKAVLCSIAIQEKFASLSESIELKIGLSTGVPVTDEEAIFEDTIRFSKRLCNFAREGIAVSAEVKDLYESENLNSFVDTKLVKALTPDEENFLNILMDYSEENWQDSNLKVEDIGKALGYSKSKLYRKTMDLAGKSPNNFIKEYRLEKAFLYLNRQEGNISEIAFKSGFNSASYFSKCFLNKYGVSPSEFLENK